MVSTWVSVTSSDPGHCMQQTVTIADLTADLHRGALRPCSAEVSKCYTVES